MTINDVEYQGDGTKAIFYYTADDRVDFRTLIKILAEEFHVRVEMKQIGVRQEAGKVGGLGTCGRELCCCTWLTSFKSVTTAAAKAQQILPNPQKLAGQCGKLKCCLNFEYDTYVDALKGFPPAGVALRFEKGLALYKKTDVLRGIMWYGYEGENDLYAIPAERVKEIIEKNRSQEYPERLEDFQVELMSATALTEESSSAEFERELSQMADDRRPGEHDDPAAKADGRRERGAAGKDRRRPRNEGGERRSGSSESQRGGSKSQSDKAPRRPAEGGRPKAPRGEEENPAADSKAGRRHGGPRRGGDSDTPRRSADHDRRG